MQQSEKQQQAVTHTSSEIRGTWTAYRADGFEWRDLGLFDRDLDLDRGDLDLLGDRDRLRTGERERGLRVGGGERRRGLRGGSTSMKPSPRRPSPALNVPPPPDRPAIPSQHTALETLAIHVSFDSYNALDYTSKFQIKISRVLWAAVNSSVLFLQHKIIVQLGSRFVLSHLNG